MKTIVAIFKPFRLETVLAAIIPLSPKITSFMEVRGYGRQKGHLDAYEGSDLKIEFIPKIRLELEIDDLFADEAIRTLREAARTGRIGDGKIFVFNHVETQTPPEDGQI